VNGGVYALTIHSNRLIAAGSFDSAGGVGAAGIAAWNGSTWAPLGAGLGGRPTALALTVYGDQLIVGGEFDTAGGLSVANIAAARPE